MAKVLVGILVLLAIAVGAVLALRREDDSGHDFGDLRDDLRDSLADLDDAELFRPAGI